LGSQAIQDIAERIDRAYKLYLCAIEFAVVRFTGASHVYAEFA
jgi:hypothetical protein